MRFLQRPVMGLLPESRDARPQDPVRVAASTYMIAAVSGGCCCAPEMKNRRRRDRTSGPVRRPSDSTRAQHARSRLTKTLAATHETLTPVTRRFREKILWTVTTLFIYLVSLPDPHLRRQDGQIERPLLLDASHLGVNRGTLMELGISPIITSGMVMQLLAGARLIEVNQSLKEDRALFAAAQKLFGILITIGEAWPTSAAACTARSRN